MVSVDTTEHKDRLLVSELLEVFNYTPWYDLVDANKEVREHLSKEDLNITLEDINNFKSDIVFTDGYKFNHCFKKNRRDEHIARIKSLMSLPPEQWEPLGIDMDWRHYTPILDDGHHRLYAAKFLALESVRIEWSGVFDVMAEAFPKSVELGLIKENVCQ